VNGALAWHTQKVLVLLHNTWAYQQLFSCTNLMMKVKKHSHTRVSFNKESRFAHWLYFWEAVLPFRELGKLSK
jgi:hypothetical protein